MQATVDLSVIQDWWETRPEANVILVTGRVFDVLDVPAVARAAALERLDAAGVAVGPVAVVGQERMLFFVMTRGSPADEDEWWSCRPRQRDRRASWRACAGTAGTATCLPPPSRDASGQAARWLRSPQEHPLPGRAAASRVPRRRLRGVALPLDCDPLP